MVFIVQKNMINMLLFILRNIFISIIVTKDIFIIPEIIKINNKIIINYNFKFIIIPELNLKISKNNFFILYNINNLFELIKICDAKCEETRNGQLIIDINGVKFNVSRGEEIYILHEVFVKRIYDFYGIENPLIIDIGMNVGIASLFFASEKNAIIYGFEPFEKTYNDAFLNFDLNPKLKNKILPFKHGLSNRNDIAKVKYDPYNKGTNSVLIKDPNGEKVILRDTSEILINILQLGNKNVLKMDCEGSEYDIISSLEKQKLITHFSLIIIEWHRIEYNDWNIIINILLENDYVITLNNNENYGLIHALKI